MPTPDAPTARERIEALIAEVQPSWKAGSVVRLHSGAWAAYCHYPPHGCEQGFGQTPAAALGAAFAKALGAGPVQVGALAPGCW